jgi:hypothetical protein
VHCLLPGRYVSILHLNSKRFLHSLGTQGLKYVSISSPSEVETYSGPSQCPVSEPLPQALKTRLSTAFPSERHVSWKTFIEPRVRAVVLRSLVSLPIYRYELSKSAGFIYRALPRCDQISDALHLARASNVVNAKHIAPANARMPRTPLEQSGEDESQQRQDHLYVLPSLKGASRKSLRSDNWCLYVWTVEKQEGRKRARNRTYLLFSDIREDCLEGPKPGIDWFASHPS